MLLEPKLTDRDDDVHVMPNDGRHRCSVECHCGPREDEDHKHFIAQGGNAARLIVHNEVQ